MYACRCCCKKLKSCTASKFHYISNRHIFYPKLRFLKSAMASEQSTTPQIVVLQPDLVKTISDNRTLDKEVLEKDIRKYANSASFYKHLHPSHGGPEDFVIFPHIGMQQLRRIFHNDKAPDPGTDLHWWMAPLNRVNGQDVFGDQTAEEKEKWFKRHPVLAYSLQFPVKLTHHFGQGGMYQQHINDLMASAQKVWDLCIKDIPATE